VSPRALHERLYGGSVDFTETGTLALGVVALVLRVVEFGLVFVVVAAFRLVTLQPEPESALLALALGVVPGVVLGAGLPCLVQYRDEVAAPSAAGARLLGGLAVSGAYLALLFGYHPVTAVVYAVGYLLSRATAVGGIYASGRLRAALS
jgi:hypothetical protein